MIVGYQPIRPSSSVAVWALVLGIVGALVGWCLLGLPSIAAIILGHIGLVETRSGHVSGRGMAVAGLVLGYVAVLPAIVLFFWIALGSAVPTTQ